MKQLQLLLTLIFTSMTIYAAEVPNEKIKFGKIFVSQNVIKVAKENPILNEILNNYSNTHLTIYLETIDSNGKEIPFQPRAGLIGTSSGISGNGEYVKFEAVRTQGVMIDGEGYYSFSIILRYQKDGIKGILYLPIWVDIDIYKVKIIDWGVIKKDISHVSETVLKKK